MRIYLAARYSRNPEMRDVRDVLVAGGHEVTSRWIDQHDNTLEESLDVDTLNSRPGYASTFAWVCLDDLRDADVVVSFTGNGGGGKGGRHIEFGLAIGLSKRMVIVGPRENVFHCLPGVTVVDTVEALVEELA